MEAPKGGHEGGRELLLASLLECGARGHTPHLARVLQVLVQPHLCILASPLLIRFEVGGIAVVLHLVPRVAAFRHPVHGRVDGLLAAAGAHALGRLRRAALTIQRNLRGAKAKKGKAGAKGASGRSANSKPAPRRSNARRKA